MQPVTITNLDRLLTALIQAKQRGDLEQTVIDCLPVEPGDAHIFGVRADNGEIKPIMLPYSSVMGFSLLLSILSKCHE